MFTNIAQKPLSVVLFDTTLRDGAQTSGVDFSPADKHKLAAVLDPWVHYVEGGWPGANDTDNRFFANPPSFAHAKLTAFGMTRRVGRSASNDEGLSMVLDSTASVVCLVGKTWDVHVTKALGTTLDDNLKSISESVLRAKETKAEVVYDLEHFFDAWKANKPYALECLKAARAAGADWLVMCDTNGGTFPHEVRQIVGEVIAEGFDPAMLGIHTHNDLSCAEANTLEAVMLGVRMVQGTLNGLGERSGNANLVTLIAMFAKLGIDCGVTSEQMRGLKDLSRTLDDILDRVPNTRQPIVGADAFTHKGGLHGSAVAKDPTLYEHMEPESVGNQRKLPMSDQGGLANLEARLKDFDIDYDRTDPRLRDVISTIKELEALGYSYDLADASFELVVRQMLGEFPHYCYVERVTANTDMEPPVNEAARVKFKRFANHPESTVKLVVGEQRLIRTAEGNGPVNAIDNALREALEASYPVLKGMTLTDFKVRIPTNKDATGAETVVRITSKGMVNGVEREWTTIGVSTNIMEASTEALMDAYDWYLFKTNTTPDKPNPKLLRGHSMNQNGKVRRLTATGG
ncbi:MAG: citramalate synthase [Proteobacteria bacterium]|nr:citramalate synthase [Pseudomonadota bacterium]